MRIHLGRSPACRRNVEDTNTSATHSSLPADILRTVKCPSTSVESLENQCGNGAGTKIHTCANSCHLCFTLSNKNRFVSTSTHRIYNSIIPEEIEFLDCKTTNVIYLITCKKCKLQYVGETIQLLRERIGKHASSFKHPEKENSCRILAEHFGGGGSFCKGASFTLHILEKLPGNGRDENKVADPAITTVRRRKEKEWMLTLRTVYPFGLNSRIGDEYKPQHYNKSIFSHFPSLKRVKEHLKVRTKEPIANTFVLDNFIYAVNESIRVNLRNTMNLIRVLLSSLKKSQCRVLFDKINDFLLDKSDLYRFKHFFTAALDILQSKIGTPPDADIKKKKPPPVHCCHINFNNKALDLINIHNILKDKNSISSLPHEIKSDPPTAVYKLSNSIRSKIFNYKQFVQDLDVDAFIADPNILPCSCHNSPFLNRDHNHIITGNLDIVTDSKLRGLLAKGPKYREPLPFSYIKARAEIVVGLDNSINAWSDKYKVPKSSFLEWKNTILSKIDDKIASLNPPNRKKNHHSVLKIQTSRQCLDDLQSKFVLVPIDKAANNIAFVCQRFYAEVLLKELGLAESPSSTYAKIDDITPADVIEKHTKELKEKFDIKVEDEMSTLPDIYWIPKLHKDPVKFRFIIASKQCTTKTLSKNLSSMFSLFQKQVESYHHKTHFFSGIKSYWIVNDRGPVLEAVKKSAARKSAKCLSSFDFSTLYTKIPHDKLIYVLNNIIDFVFKGGKRNKVSVHKSGRASWVSNAKKSSTVFDIDTIKNAVAYLINNCQFKLGNKLFRQTIGIPMGSDPAPAFANLFLFHYESNWLKEIKKTNPIIARKFGQVFRYIDDLLALNDGNSFETFFDDIYPEELQLNKENTSDTTTDFLDLRICIEDRVFTTKLFDKRDYFGFHITRLPYKDGNIPSRMFYSSIAAESLRIFRASSSSNHAIQSIKGLISRMLNQGAKVLPMRRFISKMIHRHNINHKYGATGNQLVNQVFS